MIFRPASTSLGHTMLLRILCPKAWALIFFTVGCATRMYFQLLIIVVPLSFYKK